MRGLGIWAKYMLYGASIGLLDSNKEFPGTNQLTHAFRLAPPLPLLPHLSRVLRVR